MKQKLKITINIFWLNIYTKINITKYQRNKSLNLIIICCYKSTLETIPEKKQKNKKIHIKKRQFSKQNLNF